MFVSNSSGTQKWVIALIVVFLTVVLVIFVTTNELALLILATLVAGLAILLKFPEIGLSTILFGSQLYEELFRILGFTEDTARYILFVVYGGMFFYALRRTQNRDYRFSSLKGRTLFLILAFWIWVFIASLYSPNSSAGSLLVQSLALKGTIPALSLWIFVDDVNRIQRLFVSGAIWGMLYAVLSVSELTQLFGMARYTILTFDPIVYAQSLIITVVLLLYLLELKIPNFLKTIFWILIAVIFYFVFLSQSRQAIVAMLAIGIFRLVFSSRLLSVRNFAFSLFIIGAIAVAFYSVPYSYFWRSEALLSNGFDEFAPRMMRWENAWHMFLSSPIIGMGTSSMADMSGGIINAGIRADYAHNIFLEIASEQGIVGLVIWVSLLFSVYKSGLELLRHDSELRSITVASLTLLSIQLMIFAFVSGNLSDNSVILPLIGVISVLYLSSDKQRCVGELDGHSPATYDRHTGRGQERQVPPPDRCG